MNTFLQVKDFECVKTEKNGWRILQLLNEEEHDVRFFPVSATAETLPMLRQTAPNRGRLIRASFNEVDESGGTFYREFRSFNGEGFMEVRWGQRFPYSDKRSITEEEIIDVCRFWKERFLKEVPAEFTNPQVSTE